MTWQRLVVNDAQIVGQTLSLTTAQQHYLRRVLRLRVGDRFLALNGVGALWLATLTAVDQAQLEPLPTSTAGTIARQSRPWIILAASLPKQGFDEVVRQTTELGVDQIVPILSDRTLLRPSANKLSRWRRIATEASEQSERLSVPELNQPITWDDWLMAERESCRCLCLARQGSLPLLSLCMTARPARIVVAVGPEGGWTEREIEQAVMAGYHSVTLGGSVLRAVTAAIAAISTLQAGFEFASMEP